MFFLILIEYLAISIKAVIQVERIRRDTLILSIEILCLSDIKLLLGERRNKRRIDVKIRVCIE